MYQEGIMEFLANHPVFSVSVIGSLIGTILRQVAPMFSRDYLCADEDFRFGNLGIAVFIHKDFWHFFGNLLYMIPGILICEKYYDTSFLFTIIFVFAFLSSMSCIPRKYASCGYSGIALMLFSMACLHKRNVFGIIIYILNAIATVVTDHGDDWTDGFAHKAGLVAGGLIGCFV